MPPSSVAAAAMPASAPTALRKALENLLPEDFPAFSPSFSTGAVNSLAMVRWIPSISGMI